MSDDEILKNISIERQNHFVFHEGFEGFPDVLWILLPCLATRLQRSKLILTTSGWIDFPKSMTLRSGSKCRG